VHINGTLRETLLALPFRFTGKHVFVNPATQKPWVNLKRPFNKALTKAKIKDFRFHDLRHYAEFRIMPSSDYKHGGSLTTSDISLGIIYSPLRKPMCGHLADSGPGLHQSTDRSVH
jgi:integrase